MSAGGRSPKAARDAAPSKPARPSSSSSASCASRSPAFDRQWRMAGLPVARARARLRRRLSSWASQGENIRSESRPVSPTASTRSSRAQPSIAAQSASVALSASCGWTPTAASSQAKRSTSASARSDDARFQPGTRIRSTPARRAAPSTSSTSSREPIRVHVAVGVDEAHVAMVPVAPRLQADVDCQRPTSEPSVSRTTANRPIPPPMSAGCSTTVPPFAVAAAHASSSESTVM